MVLRAPLPSIVTNRDGEFVLGKPMTADPTTAGAAAAESRQGEDR